MILTEGDIDAFMNEAFRNIEMPVLSMADREDIGVALQWLALRRDAKEKEIADSSLFLIDRLAELDWSQDYEELQSEYFSHVDPAYSRLRGALFS